LTGKIHAAEHEKIVFEGDNKQLKSDLSQTNFMFERETRENLRQLEDIKRDNKVLVETQSLDFKRQLDHLKHIAKEKEQELKEIIEKKEAEIQKLNGNIADKDVEIQTMEVNHDKEIRENTDKMRKEATERHNQLIESQSKDKDERNNEIERLQNENKKMKKVLEEEKNDYEQKLSRQGEDDEERYQQETTALKNKQKRELDSLEEEKQDYESKCLSELKTLKAEYNKSLVKVNDRHKLELEKVKDKQKDEKLDLEDKIEKGTDTIKKLKESSAAREVEFEHSLKEELTKKENVLSAEFNKLMEETKEFMNQNFLAVLNLTEKDLQFKKETSQRACAILEVELEREKAKSQKIVNDLERTKRDCRNAKHNSKLEEEVRATELELLKKKLTHQVELRNLRFSQNQFPYSGSFSPVDPRGIPDDF